MAMWWRSNRMMKRLKIPHMGWNELSFDDGCHPLMADLPHANVYFVHSYQFKTTDPAHQLATVGYGGDVTAVVGQRQYGRVPSSTRKKARPSA